MGYSGCVDEIIAWYIEVGLELGVRPGRSQDEGRMMGAIYTHCEVIYQAFVLDV